MPRLVSSAKIDASRSVPSRYGSMRESCEPRCMSRPTSSTFGSAAATCGDVHDVVVRDAELVPLAARLDVVVRRVERDLRVHANRHARADLAFAARAGR